MLECLIIAFGIVEFSNRTKWTNLPPLAVRPKIRAIRYCALSSDHERTDPEQDKAIDSVS